VKNIFIKQTAASAPSGPAAPAALPVAGATEPAPQNTPQQVALPGGKSAWFNLELVVRTGTRLLVAGWRHGPLEFSVLRNGTELPGKELPGQELDFERADVNAHFGVAADQQLGFVLVVDDAQSNDALSLQWSGAGESLGSRPLSPRTIKQVGEEELALLGPARSLLAHEFPRFGKDWCRAVAGSRDPAGDAARGFLEMAAAVRSTTHAVLCGWVATEPGAVVWVEDDAGDAYPIEGACWRDRQDVFQAVGAEMGAAALRSGFVLHLRTRKPTTRLRLMALTSRGVHQLGDIACTVLAADPITVSRWLFGIQAPDEGLAQRFEQVSKPLLDALIADSRALWPQLPVVSRDLGVLPAKPVVSVIVPLYARYDFVENQMVEWARDPWIREHAELIYVLDDPALAPSFRAHAEELAKLYRIPFRWVWGNANRGFSGANNLGAAQANGEYLLFLNSDVFPQQPGWLQRMVEVLATRADIGVVAPRLTFAEGGIQHAGMRFERLEEFGVWVNQHPCMGLDPSLDPHKELTLVPAVTGACMLLRRTDFDRIGGWDTGYLIGDFEDSDLCLKLREGGLQAAYLPQVQLTHLERQSMTALGSSDFRIRVTLWNALRHQGRWRSLIETPVEAAL
jgi:GT2 family glycosyltransferase